MDLSQVLFASIVKQFCENTNSFMVIQPKTGKNFSLVYILLVGSVTIANSQSEWIESTSFNRIQDGAWL